MQKILVIGDVIIDKYSYGEVKRLNPEGPNPLLNIKNEEFRLGGSANVAANISSLNGSCDLIGIIGIDKNSEIFSELCIKNDINLLGFTSTYPTITKHRFIELTYKQQLLRVDYEEDTYLEDFHIDEIIEIIKKNKYKFIVISDYNKGIISKKLIENIKKLDILILVDSKPKNIELFSDVYLIKPNFKEFCDIIGKNIDNDDISIEKYGTEFVKQYRTNLVITRGNKGASIITKELKYFHIETEAKEVFDVTGAGDTFIATVSYALLNGYDLVDAVKLGNKASGIIIGKIGTEIIKKGELF